MLATMIHAPRDIRVEEQPLPTIALPTDAVVRVVAACVCGSDLWPYRGVRPTHQPHGIGHELVGIVEEVGADVSTVKPGDFVISPFTMGDGTCVNCRNGWNQACEHLTGFGGPDATGHLVQGAQSAYVRIPYADGTLQVVPGDPAPELIPHLLTLADVMSTGHHAAVSAQVGPGSTVVVVGDGAVGLCAVLASKRLGARRIIAMSRHADRQALALEFGATDIVAERGEAGIERVRELLTEDGEPRMADSALECVGTAESMDQALRSVRAGGYLGFVGVPAGGSQFPIRYLFDSNIHVAGGMAPAHRYIPELLPEVLDGSLQPGKVFDLELPLAEAAEAYRAMDERRAIKVLLRP
ncbi:zinc-binding dehydrogenase [Psychromicrobium xiongbiense]|uniref:zinc-binding dehydrogenase n=1 Tax=Psychromicrobium xiongbiense TaxID=3051184 RepID=UPI00255698B6|nr:alcohol dehydrogenase catalytic domain-containing protein [Psychromicrobium sp. YIM S02556]